MRRRLRLGLLLAAAVLQIAAPFAAYARVAQLPDALELCSAAKSAAPGAQRHGNPFQKPAHIHCIESLCCIGGATGAVAPPCAAAGAHFREFTSVALPAATPSAAPASIVAAAPARGPPHRT
jgi:hypothetical protein